MSIACLIVSWNGSELIAPCIESVLGQEPRPEILMVDNASDDDTVKKARALAPAGEAEVIEVVENPVNLGFTKGANIGMDRLLSRTPCPDVILLLNQDATLTAGFVGALGEALAAHPDAAAIGCKILYPDGETIQHAGGLIESPRMFALHHGQHEVAASREFDEPREVDFVTGAVMALRTAALREVGLFDAVFAPGYYEDVDLCVRFRAQGMPVIYWPDAVALHGESASFDNWHERWTLSHRNRLIFALPELLEPGFSKRFAEAERASFEETNSVAHLRALAQAYFEVLLKLWDLVPDRARGPEPSAETMARLSSLFLELRNTCLEHLHARLVPGAKKS